MVIFSFYLVISYLFIFREASKKSLGFNPELGVGRGKVLNLSENLLAPTGALIVIVCYYSLFLSFPFSSLC